jgi:ComF family protein
LQSIIKQYVHGLIGIVYPQFCAACGNVLFLNEEVLCLNCYAELPRTGFHTDPENEVARLFWGRLPVRNATSFIYFNKNSRYRQILHELKYKGQQRVGIEMGRLFGLELKETPFARADLILPVPLHSSKYRKRGYNQSELFARGISQILGIPVTSGLVIRTMETTTQTKKTRYERWVNVKDTFQIQDPGSLRDKHILLVDDVITTGATIEACAGALLLVNGVTLSIASLACVKLQS